MSQSAPTVEFSADRTLIRPGECVTFRWHVEGVKAVYFFAEGRNWEDHGAAGVAEKQICPSQTTAYRLRVVKVDDSVEERKITVQVQPGSEAVQTFSVDRMDIQPGECVTFRWHVEGVKAVYFFADGQNWQDHGAAGVAEKQVCPSGTNIYRLRVIRRDDSVEEHGIRVQVHTAAQGIAQVFSVDRDEVGPGEPVIFRWRVEGVQAVYLYPEGEPWQEHGVVGVGERRFNPMVTTTYCLRVIRRDGSTEIHYITVQVRG